METDWLRQTETDGQHETAFCLWNAEAANSQTEPLSTDWPDLAWVCYHVNPAQWVPAFVHVYLTSLCMGIATCVLPLHHDRSVQLNTWDWLKRPKFGARKSEADVEHQRIRFPSTSSLPFALAWPLRCAWHAVQLVPTFSILRSPRNAVAGELLNSRATARGKGQLSLLHSCPSHGRSWNHSVSFQSHFNTCVPASS